MTKRNETAKKKYHLYMNDCRKCLEFDKDNMYCRFHKDRLVKDRLSKYISCYYFLPQARESTVKQ